MTTHNRLGEHAVVIGGSLGGLLAGRVLSDRFDRVTILERDVVPVEPEPRKGIPQGRHVHTLFGRGAEVVERLLPGFWDEMTKDGVTEIDFARELAWFHHGVWKLQFDSGLRSFWMSRPFLESRIRRRVRQIENISYLEQVDVTGLVANEDNSRVTGVRVVHRSNGDAEETIAGDVVIDAGGRGSRVPVWLESLGYEPPAESIVEVNITYASRIFERPAENPPSWKVLGIYGTPPEKTRTGYIFPIEGNRWLASCVGFLGDKPPGDEAGWLEFAKSLERPDFYEAVRDAKPVSPISVYAFPTQLRRHYEKMSRFPDGLLVLGDAACSFNPVYGQGMCSCALQVEELEYLLGLCTNEIPAGLPNRFFRRTGKLIDNPWLLATSADFLYPRTKGYRRWGTKLLLWYLVQVLRISAHNKTAVQTFYEVMHFYKSPTALFRPSIALRAIKRGLGLRGRRKDRDDGPIAG